VFQLHPNAYRFAAGHVVKLELLPNDATTTASSSYGRPSEDQRDVTVRGLELRLPVLEHPGYAGIVEVPLPKVVPPGYQLASDFAGP
jgi:hypothetical protein